jgi:hypothetical protein
MASPHTGYCNCTRTAVQAGRRAGRYWYCMLCKKVWSSTTSLLWMPGDHPGQVGEAKGPSTNGGLCLHQLVVEVD